MTVFFNAFFDSFWEDFLSVSGVDFRRIFSGDFGGVLGAEMVILAGRGLPFSAHPEIAF